MKTARYKTIGKYQVFDRFDILPVDPEMTRQRTSASIEALDEKQAVNEKTRQRMAVNAKGREALKKGKIAQGIAATSTDVATKAAALKTVAEQKKLFESLQTQDKAIEAELTELNAAFGEAAKEYRRKNSVYCQPRKNEVVLSDDQFQELFIANAEKSENHVIALKVSEKTAVIIEKTELQEEVSTPVMVYGGFELVNDYRGMWWIFAECEWLQNVIDDLGVIPDGHIRASDLTTEQREEIRLQSLSDDEKRAEYDSLLAALKKQAALLVNEYMIDGMTQDEAVADAQAWLAGNTAELNEKYGIDG